MTALEATATDAVAAVGLTRSFGDVRAVDAVDLSVERGAVFGLLGPDGAGKSTLIRMLATVLSPDAGDAEVFGVSVTAQADRVTPRIGYMSQQFSMYPDLTVAENLDFFATIRGVPKQVRRQRAASLLAGMGLAEFAGPPGPVPLRRHEAEADAGLHADARARPAAARRADHRRRPGVAPRVLADPRRPAPRRQDRPGRHPLHGRGRALHRHRLHGRRTHPPPRHPGRDQGPGPGHAVRGRRARPAGRAGGAQRHPRGQRPATCSATSSACSGGTTPTGSRSCAPGWRTRECPSSTSGRRPSTWRPRSRSSPRRRRP